MTFIDRIQFAIKGSPLEDAVKTSLLTITTQPIFVDRVGKIESRLVFAAPEINKPREYTDELFHEYFGSVMSANGVPKPQGTDTWRNVYHAIGGEGELQYQVSQPVQFPE